LIWAEFEALAEQARTARPGWFAGERDPAPSAAELAAAEQALGVELPEDYRTFLGRYGGGYFGAAIVFNTKLGGDWDIVANNRRNDTPASFLAVSDDEAGGVYGFKVLNGVCSAEVFYLYPSETGDAEAVAGDFLGFLADYALRALPA
jgi:hypothetical protein